jgi:hypothetical protein
VVSALAPPVSPATSLAPPPQAARTDADRASAAAASRRGRDTLVVIFINCLSG